MKLESASNYPFPIEPSQAITRLRWLMRLRWLALIGVSGGATFAVIGFVSGLNLNIISLAVCLGIGSNVYIRWQISQRESVDLEGLHVGQAILDTLVLTLVIWASGGTDCPFISFYIFPVLLAALLSGRRTFWPTAVASLCGILWQELSVISPLFRVGDWNPKQPWGDALDLIAIILTMGMAAYFAARFTDALRQQVQARRAADTLLHLAFERLDAGVELIEEGEIKWQNHHAKDALGHRSTQLWRCPGYGRRPNCPHAHRGCQLVSTGGPARCQFTLDSPRLSGSLASTTSASIYEFMLLSPPQYSQRVALYVERTAEVAYQQKLMHTERLASLGRTAQGVAHELNTPLATIQTLGRDLFDVLSHANLSESIREDIEESTQVILDEVQRCSRITHALLGRAELKQGGHGSLERALTRSISLVYPHERERVSLVLNELGYLQYPLDPLMQIFVNLLQNAADVSPVAPIVVEVTQRAQPEDGLDEESEGGAPEEFDSIGSERASERFPICISVIDRGGGLNEASLSMIFEPFYTTKSPGQGTGLGLYTSYALARELRGELSLKNNEIGGATASLSLPLPSS